jgi:hypothetical protein
MMMSSMIPLALVGSKPSPSLPRSAPQTTLYEIIQALQQKYPYLSDREIAEIMTRSFDLGLVMYRHEGLYHRQPPGLKTVLQIPAQSGIIWRTPASPGYRKSD